MVDATKATARLTGHMTYSIPRPLTGHMTYSIPRPQQCLRKTFSIYFVSLSQWKITLLCFLFVSQKIESEDEDEDDLFGEKKKKPESDEEQEESDEEEEQPKKVKIK